MAKQREAPVSVYQALVKNAGKLARADDVRTPADEKSGKGVAKAQAPGTEYAAAAARLAAIDDALKADCVALARAAVEDATARCATLRADVVALKTERSNHELRRRKLADEAQSYDWTMVHRDRLDFIGPLTLDHSPEGSKISLGYLKLRSLDFPSGAELFHAIKYERSRLDGLARSLWPRLRDILVRLQGPGGSATWPQFAGAFDGPDSSFKKVEAGVLYALVLLRVGALEPGWSLSTKPPALAQQATAISLPRVDRPGAPDRVFAIRTDGPSTGPR